MILELFGENATTVSAPPHAPPHAHTEEGRYACTHPAIFALFHSNSQSASSVHYIGQRPQQMRRFHSFNQLCRVDFIQSQTHYASTDLKNIICGAGSCEADTDADRNRNEAEIALNDAERRDQQRQRRP